MGTTAKPLAIVAGAGPGLGSMLIQRFAAGGYHTVGLRRAADTAADRNVVAVDLSRPADVEATIADLVSHHGAPKVVVHNPSRLVIGPLAHTSLDQFEACWRDMAFSAAVLAHATLPRMAEAGGGAFLVSGATASLRGGARFSAFASAKFALRGLTQSLAREFQPRSIHVAHIILDGIIDTAASRALHGLAPARMMSPDDIAETFWQTAHQPHSTWSHEIDLRPPSETF
jgi:NAD(P)-dependent dehydrogenase (short-subunit alcohol dehydrogenase family)